MTSEARLEEREERLQDIVAGYLERLDAGTAEKQDELLARHPEFASELAEFLAVRERIDGVTAPFRQAVGHVDGVAHGGCLGDFRIVRVVGKGGMGIVYEAEQISLRRRVALKVLPFAATMDERHLQRFHNEAQAAACLHHTNIVPVFSVGCERGVHFYAMQYINGQPLSELIRQMSHSPRLAGGATHPRQAGGCGTVSVADLTPLTGEGQGGRNYFHKVAELGVQAAEALDHAHQLGIVHRDIKPANLLLDGRGNVWVTDFGLAHMRYGDTSLTLTGQTVGTPRYMSPEQAWAKRVPLDHRTDVYSLGVTLYELLTLRPAFTSDDRQELLRQIAFEEPVAPRRLDRTIPQELEIIVLKALAKEPTERYATAHELADDLRRFVDDKPIRARRPSWFQRGRRWFRRHQAAVTAAVLALAVAFAVSTALIWHEQKQTKTALTERETQRQLAEDRATEASVHQQRAESNLRRALEENLILLEKLDSSQWMRKPGISEARHLIANDALAFFGDLIDESDPDPAVQEQTGVVYVYMGHVYTSMRDFANGEKAYRKALAVFDRMAEKHPEEPLWQFEMGQAHNILGMGLYDAGRRDEAVRKFQEAEASYRRNLTLREDAPALSILAGFLVSCRDPAFHNPPEALAFILKALDKDPGNGDYLAKQGMALYRLGRYHEAAIVLVRALEKPQGDHCLKCLFLAMANSRSGQEKEARDRYRQALQLMAESEYHDRASRRRFRAEAEQLSGIKDDVKPKK